VRARLRVRLRADIWQVSVVLDGRVVAARSSADATEAVRRAITDARAVVGDEALSDLRALLGVDGR